MGAMEEAWRAAGCAVVESEHLPRPAVLLIAGRPPLAAVPSWGRGACREAWFGWCLVELAERRGGWAGVVARAAAFAAAD